MACPGNRTRHREVSPNEGFPVNIAPRLLLPEEWQELKSRESVVYVVADTIFFDRVGKWKTEFCAILRWPFKGMDSCPSGHNRVTDSPEDWIRGEVRQ